MIKFESWLPNHYEMIVTILENEKEIILAQYDPETEGTGHFNTAASVLQMRIDYYKTKLNDSFQVKEIYG